VARAGHDEHDDGGGRGGHRHADQAPSPAAALLGTAALLFGARFDLGDGRAGWIAGELGVVVGAHCGDAFGELARVGAVEARGVLGGALVERGALEEPVGKGRHGWTSMAWSFVRSLCSRLRTPDTLIPTSAATSSSVILSCRCKTAIKAVSSGSWRNSV